MDKVKKKKKNTFTHYNAPSSEQYYSTGREAAIKEACKFAGNSKYDIPLTFKEKTTIRRRMMFDYKNGDDPIANPENRFRTEHFNVMVNEIK
jgi:GDP-D-mannose dehydratase